jgi:hypothetical protein
MWGQDSKVDRRYEDVSLSADQLKEWEALGVRLHRERDNHTAIFNAMRQKQKALQDLDPKLDEKQEENKTIHDPEHWMRAHKEVMAIMAQIHKITEEAAAMHEKYNDQTKAMKAIIEMID